MTATPTLDALIGACGGNFIVDGQQDLAGVLLRLPVFLGALQHGLSTMSEDLAGQHVIRPEVVNLLDEIAGSIGQARDHAVHPVLAAIGEFG